jgi:cytochrome c oxidase assembly protein subunit 15
MSKTDKVTTHETAYSRLPFILATLLVVVTFPLIWVGGLVTTYDAGMAVPDWPGTYGYNLFLYPLETWLFGPFDLLIEHGHRLLGSLAGFITIGLVAVTFWKDSRPAARFAAIAALVLVIVQGSLGGARVLMDARTVAMIHGCVGPAFFAFAAFLCVLLSKYWRQPSPVEITVSRANSILVTSISLLGLAYLQLVLGAMLRHVSPAADFWSFQAVVTFHIVVAIGLVISSCGFAVWLLFRRTPLSVSGPPVAIALLVLVQFLLGSGTWFVEYAVPAFAETSLRWIDSILGTAWSVSASSFVIEANGLMQSLVVTGHVANGSLILATAAWSATRHFRCFALLREERRFAEAPAPSPKATQDNSVQPNSTSQLLPITFSTPSREPAL